MKKLMILAGAVAMMLSVTACKKDYTCSCTYDLAGTSTDFSYKIEKAKKQDAEDSCKAAEDVYKIADPNASCSL